MRLASFYTRSVCEATYKKVDRLLSILLVAAENMALKRKKEEKKTPLKLKYIKCVHNTSQVLALPP